MIRYAVSMGVRIVCFILAVVVQNWMTWVFLGLAVVLPYVAVTLANAGGDRYIRRSESEDLNAPAMLTAEPEPEPRQWWESEDEQDDDAESGNSTAAEGGDSGAGTNGTIPGHLASDENSP